MRINAGAEEVTKSDQLPTLGYPQWVRVPMGARLHLEARLSIGAAQNRALANFGQVFYLGSWALIAF